MSSRLIFKSLIKLGTILYVSQFRRKNKFKLLEISMATMAYLFAF